MNVPKIPRVVAYNVLNISLNDISYYSNKFQSHIEQYHLIINDKLESNKWRRSRHTV